MIVITMRSSAGGVAPLAGAWIEIYIGRTKWEADTSLPSRERGLKSYFRHDPQSSQSVAPLAGAWIEILNSGCAHKRSIRRSPRGSVD